MNACVDRVTRLQGRVVRWKAFLDIWVGGSGGEQRGY